MLLAIAGTLLHREIVDYRWIAAALVIGTIIGIPLGRVQMTAVPQRTALSHAFGALCVTLVGIAEYFLMAPHVPQFTMGVLSLEVILGGLTLTGSLMAAGKLQEILPQRPITRNGQNFVNLSVLAVAVLLGAYRRRLRPVADGPLPAGMILLAASAFRRADDHPDRAQAPTCRPSSRCSTRTRDCRRRRWASRSTTSS